MDDFMDSVFAESQETNNSDSELTQVNQLARMMEDKILQIEQIEADLKRAKNELVDIQERQLPDFMDSVGLTDFTTMDGKKIEIKDQIRASIAKKNSVPAFNWLRESGYGDLIKRQVIGSFGRGEDEKAAQAIKELEKFGIKMEDKSSVHAQTLSAWVRTKLEEGADLPHDLLGIFIGRKAVIK